MTRIATKTLRGVECEVHCSPHGRFSIIVKHQDPNDPSSIEEDEIANGYDLQKVTESAEKRLRSHNRIRVAIPFTTHDLKHATATGKHTTSNQILAYVDDNSHARGGHAIRLPFYTRAYKPHLPQKAIEQRKRLEAIRDDVDERLKKWDKKYLFNLYAEVTRAVREREEEIERERDKS